MPDQPEKQLPKKRKPVQKNIVHYCVQEDKIVQMHKLITGNGEPEKGILVQILLMNERHDNISKSLDDIKKTLSSLDNKYDETVKLSNIAISAVEKYKAEDEAFDNGVMSSEEKQKIEDERLKKEKEDKRSNKQIKWMAVGVMIAAIVGFGNLYLNNRGAKASRDGEHVIMLKIDSLSKDVKENTKKINVNSQRIDAFKK